ncbi:MAG: NADPH-dependent 2,4-dienoyl-CoA reductase [Ornithinimicrobium sp.]|uniref:NADPH-dependent 2,4-dienoyl-CoA reductase n=1 Tax=Ornithinimicrobium sp. TaxID=1977084 RepID=UPI0026E06B63|nr:NADPH-dependent 2,4-dienoyl-CoA reductase [Ornithinimicrobium sp.]MDO5739671.1 NADPH-dependent 2,4-dienoyl-CoA reductase [Ornithinimicrobium sp.]
MTSDSAYPHLLSPIDVLGGQLRNRVIMGSMHTGLEDRPWHHSELTAYFVERARGGVGLIVTGGYAPTIRGWLTPLGAQLTSAVTARRHRSLTAAVHEHGAKIALQLLHAGRYGYTPFAVSASASKSPITPFSASEMSARSVDRTATAFARSARLAQRAGYDGVEIMGSEGYLLNQFLAPRTNHRTDAWGGTPEKRMRLAVEVVRRVREAVGEDFLLLYRISLIDLVEGGQTWQEVVELAQRLEEVGVSIFNTGIGWHEARVPTIITQVPQGAWADLTARLRREVGVPVSASNRINSPQMAEQLIADGSADLVSMARPFLADPEFVAKASAGRADEINTCIACNQACLDHVFVGKRASCLVNPRAGRETELVLGPTRQVKKVAVVGAGPAGLSAAVAAAERGHVVTLFEAGAELGGQFRYAMRIPGKADFGETLRYFRRRLEVLGTTVRLGTPATAADLEGFDEVVLATGVRPRVPAMPGVDHPSVVTYADLLAGQVRAGPRVAVVGAGGIGVDVSHFLTHVDTDLAGWKSRWGVADPAVHRGGLTEKDLPVPPRAVWLLQRKTTRIGAGLGKTSGWAHRINLRDAGVVQLTGVTYERIDDAGLHLLVDGQPQLLDVDTIVLCAGQESVRDLAEELPGAHVIGGAEVAAELDAERAIRQGVELAARL